MILPIILTFYLFIFSNLLAFFIFNITSEGLETKCKEFESHLEPGRVIKNEITKPEKKFLG